MTAADRLRALLERLNTALERGLRVLAIALVAAMSAVILLQVFFRYGLGDALTWTEEAARYLMVWMTFAVAPIAYRAGAYVTLDVLLGVLPPPARRGLAIAIDVAVIVLLVVLYREAIGMIGRGLRITAQTLPMPMAWVYLALPLGYTGMLLAGVERILSHVTGHRIEAAEGAP